MKSVLHLRLCKKSQVKVIRILGQAGVRRRLDNSAFDVTIEAQQPRVLVIDYGNVVVGGVNIYDDLIKAMENGGTRFRPDRTDQDQQPTADHAGEHLSASPERECENGNQQQNQSQSFENGRHANQRNQHERCQ